MKILFDKKVPITSEDTEIKFDIWDEDKQHLGAIQPEVLVISGKVPTADTAIALYSGESETELNGVLTESLTKGKVSESIDSTTLAFGPVAYDVTGTYNGEYNFAITQDAQAQSEDFEGAYLYIKVLYEG